MSNAVTRIIIVSTGYDATHFGGGQGAAKKVNRPGLGTAPGTVNSTLARRTFNYPQVQLERWA